MNDNGFVAVSEINEKKIGSETEKGLMDIKHILNKYLFHSPLIAGIAVVLLLSSVLICLGVKWRSRNKWETVNIDFGDFDTVEENEFLTNTIYG